MTRRTRWGLLGLVIAAGALSLSPGVGSAQAGGAGPVSCPWGGWGPGAGRGGGRMMGWRGHGMGPGTRMYDPSTLTTVQGRIADIQRVPGRWAQGVRLLITVGAETISVHLGPDFYVDDQPVQLARGDTVEVKGSRITFAGQPAVIAQEVTRGDEVLSLRNASGFPLWAAAGRGW